MALFTIEMGQLADASESKWKAGAGEVTSGKWRISWSSKRASAHNLATGEKVVLCENDEMAGDKTASSSLISVVGTVASIQFHYESYDGANSNHGSYLTTIRIGGGPTPLVTELFSTEVLLAAFLNARPIAGRLGGKRPSDFAQLIEVLAEGDCFTDWARLLSSFAIMEVRKDTAHVRFGLKHGCSASQGANTELDFLLPIPRANRRWFSEAKKQRSIGMNETWGGNQEWTCCLKDPK